MGASLLAAAEAATDGHLGPHSTQLMGGRRSSHKPSASAVAFSVDQTPEKSEWPKRLHDYANGLIRSRCQFFGPPKINLTRALYKVTIPKMRHMWCITTTGTFVQRTLQT